jgi:hypothetical protein
MSTAEVVPRHVAVCIVICSHIFTTTICFILIDLSPHVYNNLIQLVFKFETVWGGDGGWSLVLREDAFITECSTDGTHLRFRFEEGW